METWSENGKLRRAKTLPDGLYIYSHGEKVPERHEYNGFKIIWEHRAQGNKHGKAPNFISDTMTGTVNPVDGKMYDSKSRYYRTVKEAGCEIVGCDSSFGKSRPKELSSEDRKRDIARAIYNN